MNKALPPEIFSKHTAVLGMTGSGKTSTTKLLIEQVASECARVCILDPIKSDHWGLTSNRAGTGPGLPFQILGGPHGHVPLHPGAGAAIAEIVATGKLPLSIVDMSEFPVGGLQHFFNDFAPMLMKKMRGVLYLVIEEAHEFCPKEKSSIAGENMAVYHTKKLATAGRSKGVRLVVATQRVQALHNAVLGSCSTVIVHRMSMPADQEPVTKWLKGSIKDRSVREQIEDSMPELADGEGWICSGVNKILERVQFPRIKTFDNSATPEDDRDRGDVVMAKVDVEQLRQLIGNAAAAAEENDPKALKARIAELERRGATLERELKKAGVTGEDLEQARQRGFSEGAKHGYTRGWDEHEKCVRMALERVVLPHGAITFPAPKNDRGAVHVPTVGSAEFAPAAPKRSNGHGIDLPPKQQEILDALAELEQLGVDRPEREIVAFMVGYSHLNSKGFANGVGALRSAGLIQPHTGDGTILLTDAGRHQAQPPARPRTPQDLQARVISLLGGATARVLQPLIDAYPKALPRERLAESAGYGHLNSKGFANSMGRLRTLGFIDYPDRGSVVAKPVLFLEQ